MLSRSHLQIEVRSLEPGVCQLILVGDLDFDTAGQLPVSAAQVLATGVRRLDVDLSKLEFIDSSGLGALIRVRKDARRHEAGLRLVAMTPRVRRLLRVTCLDTVFDLGPDL
ncbi:MAG: STAS domain-containing protein [Thermoactinospora sp.]|nr:STAS domain-containing protein [Thermoactinospora sp.]